MEEGFPNATGREQSIKGMRTSEFCLHPAGDTPTSCRLFDAIQSLCIPVIVSDNIELPFEGMVDYSEFSVFVAVRDSLLPNWLVSHLRSFSKGQRDRFRQNMARVQPIFQYDNGHPAGIGPIPPDGAVNHIWKKVHQKLPMIKEAIIREKRKPPGASVPLRCLCTWIMSSFFSSMVADKWFIYLVIYQNMTYCFLFQHNVVIIWYIFSFANLIQLNIVQRKIAGLPVFFNTTSLNFWCTKHPSATRRDTQFPFY